MAWHRSCKKSGGNVYPLHLLSQADMAKIGAQTLASEPIRFKIPLYGRAESDNFFIKNADNEYYFETSYNNNKSFCAIAKIPADAKTLYLDASCGVGGTGGYPNFYIAVTNVPGINGSITGYNTPIKQWRITSQGVPGTQCRQEDGGNVTYTSDYVAPRQIMSFDLTPYNQELYFCFYNCHTVVKIWDIWVE